MNKAWVADRIDSLHAARRYRMKAQRTTGDERAKFVRLAKHCHEIARAYSELEFDGSITGGYGADGIFRFRPLEVR